MLARLVLPVNNRYTGLIRANIRYDQNGKKILMEGGLFLNRGEGKYHLPTMPRKL